MFDKVDLTVKAGRGGDGAVSFRREKFVPYGGPDGGNGGRGGDVIVVAETSVSSLRMFRQKRSFRAAAGENGGRRRKHGRNGESIVLEVPVGTLVTQKNPAGDDWQLADLEKSGQKVVVARGGRGGLGNIHFKSPTNQAPRIAKGGDDAEENEIILEMRLIADVGIIGYPNAGKSTLLTAASAARPKIANYPFTTLEPVLGMVEVGVKGFVMAEIPGLIEKAHLGRGLGHDFLRHSLRTRILIHLVDGSEELPVANMMQVNAELALFDSTLIQKPQLVVVNKTDLPPVAARMEEMKGEFGSAGTALHFISAETGQGVRELMAAAMTMLDKLATRQATVTGAARKVFRPQPREAASVWKDGEVYVVEVAGMARLITPGGVATSEVSWNLKKRLARLGVSKTLEKAGIKPGDKVRCGNIELEW